MFYQNFLPKEEDLYKILAEKIDRKYINLEDYDATNATLTYNNSYIKLNKPKYYKELLKYLKYLGFVLITP